MLFLSAGGLKLTDWSISQVIFVDQKDSDWQLWKLIPVNVGPVPKLLRQAAESEPDDFSTIVTEVTTVTVRPTLPLARNAAFRVLEIPSVVTSPLYNTCLLDLIDMIVSSHNVAIIVPA